MRKNQHLVIVLPEGSEELPIRIVRGSRSFELRLCPPDGEERHINETCPERKYVFIWRQNDYLKTAVDEIQWIEAAGSYSRIHLTGGRILVISFNLASVRRKLPESIRIHRSRIVNLRHVETLVGNRLKIGNELLAIGREYKDALFERVIFLGVTGNSFPTRRVLYRLAVDYAG